MSILSASMISFAMPLSPKVFMYYLRENNMTETTSFPIPSDFRTFVMYFYSDKNVLPVLRGIALFNEGKFYEAHEEWEQIWLKEKGEDRLFYQGLIQLAGAFHHQQKGKMKEAQTALAKAILKLKNYPPMHWGIDLAGLLADLSLGSFPKIRKGFF